MSDNDVADEADNSGQDPELELLAEVKKTLAKSATARKKSIKREEAYRGAYILLRDQKFSKGKIEELLQHENFIRVEQDALRSNCAFVSLSKSGRTWVRFLLQLYVDTCRGVPFDARPNTLRGW